MAIRSTGGFGLLVYDCLQKTKPIIKKAHGHSGFIGINYIPEFDAILAVESGKIAFFNSENLDSHV